MPPGCRCYLGSFCSSCGLRRTHARPGSRDGLEVARASHWVQEREVLSEFGGRKKKTGKTEKRKEKKEKERERTSSAPQQLEKLGPSPQRLDLLLLDRNRLWLRLLPVVLHLETKREFGRSVQ